MLRVVAAALVLVVLGGCGDGDEGEDVAPATVGRVSLKLTHPDDGASTRSRTVSVEGIVTTGARVTVNGRRARLAGPATSGGRDRFELRLPLRLGRNRLAVVAIKDGLRAARVALDIVRRKPAPRDVGEKDRVGHNDPQGGPAAAPPVGRTPQDPPAPAIRPQGGGVAPERPQGGPQASPPAPDRPQGGPPAKPSPEERPQGGPLQG